MHTLAQEITCLIETVYNTFETQFYYFKKQKLLLKPWVFYFLLLFDEVEFNQTLIPKKESFYIKKGMIFCYAEKRFESKKWDKLTFSD